jgi:hypothetical protein
MYKTSRCSWHSALGSWHSALGTRLWALGTRLRALRLALGSWLRALGSWRLARGSWHSALGSWLSCGTRHSCNLVSGHSWGCRHSCDFCTRVIEVSDSMIRLRLPILCRSFLAVTSTVFYLRCCDNDDLLTQGLPLYANVVRTHKH